LELPPTTEIELNLSSDAANPSWQRLDDLSTGQKATAVLLLLLLESEAPLVVDQPEDDLDNRFIRGVVPHSFDCWWTHCTLLLCNKIPVGGASHPLRG